MHVEADFSRKRFVEFSVGRTAFGHHAIPTRYILYLMAYDGHSDELEIDVVMGWEQLRDLRDALHEAVEAWEKRSGSESTPIRWPST